MTYQLVWHGTRIAGFAFGCLNLIINRPGPTGCPSSTTWFLRLSCFCCAFEMSEPPLSPFFVQTYRDNNVSTNVAHFNAIIVVRSHPFITTAPVYASFDDISIVIIQWNSFWSVPSCHFILFLSNDLSISHYKACRISTVNLMHFLFKLKIDHC